MDPDFKDSNEALWDILKTFKQRKIEEKFENLENHVAIVTKCPKEKLKDLRQHLSHFKSEFKLRWKSARYTESVFIKRNTEWLSGVVKLPTFTTQSQPGGRPMKSFQESSDRSKRRKTEALRLDKTHEELSYATQMSMRKSGQVDAAKVTKDITNSSPNHAKKYIKTMKKDNQQKQLSPLEALALFVEGEFTRRQYNIMQKADKKKFPSYTLVQKEKLECYPPRESFRVLSTCAEIKLQPLLDHTATRLCLSLSQVIANLTAVEKQNLQLLSKWGCDGSQQSQYKQKFENDVASDANIFQSSFVYLQLVTEVDGQRSVLWQNPTPSSPRYCRPIRIQFVHETTDITKEEVKYIEDQIKNLQKTQVKTDSGTVFIKHTLVLTMVDGKVCNAVTDTKYTRRCYICGATSTEFNNIDAMAAKAIASDNLRFGLSVLHARIRFFESLLHLSYKLPVKKWEIKKKDTESKKKVDAKKKDVQDKFKEEMGLLVDFPKAGFGNTNDGNTSRRFFCDVEKSAAITGIEPELIQRYKIVLEAISCGLSIDSKKFGKYCLETAKLYVQLYEWHPMPPTVHKVLVHGAAVISSAILPVGQLSEEAAEARNKYFRKYRHGYSRKFSREACNWDIIHRLLLQSDPLITGMRSIPKKKTRPFSRETIEMLLAPEIDRAHSSGSRV